MIRVVLLNGPGGVGKNTMAEQYAKENTGVLPLSIMRPVHEQALAAFDMPPSAVHELDVRGLKDTRLADLGDRTPRDVYIAHGNELRETHGASYIADMWLKRAAELMHQCEVIVVPDVRLQQEVNAAVRLAGTRNVLLVHVAREGRTWRNDLGTWCDHDRTHTIINNYPAHDLGGVLRRVVTRWIGEKP